MTRLLLATASAVALVAHADTARAQCVVSAGGGTASMPAAGATVTCEGALETDPVVAPGANGVTVEVVGPSGGISVTGDGAVQLGDGATVTIDANGQRPITTSGGSAVAIDVGDGATVEVGGRVATAGEASPGIVTGEQADVTVEGVVTTGGGTSNAIDVGANSTVTVTSSGQVNTQTSGSTAVRLRGDGATLEVLSEQTAQNGLQSGLVTTSSGGSNPVLVEGDDGTVTVAGEVRSASGDATAILVTGDGAEIVVEEDGVVSAQSSNSDAIRVEGEDAVITVASGGAVRISSGNSAAIRSGVGGTVTVGGRVGISSSNSQGVVLSEGATLTVEAGGLIETSSSESQAVLIGPDATTSEVTVARGGDIDAVGAQAIVDEGETDTTVTVDGVVFGGSSEPVIDLAGGDDAVIVNGTVRGSSASPVISLGAGDDRVEVNSSTTIEGPGTLVAGGEGEDSLTLANGEANRSSDYTGFETTNVRGNTNPDDPRNGENTSLEVDSEGGAVNAQDGGDVAIGSGGSATDARAENGGTVTVGAGGRADRVQANGGSVRVREGGTAGLDERSAGGGAVTFDRGSTAEVRGEASTGPQSQSFAGTSFSEGTRVSVANSAVLQGTARTDGDTGTVDLSLPEDAFARFAAGQGAEGFGAALDAGAAGGEQQAVALITASAADLRATMSEGSGAGAAQAAATGIGAALAFGDLLAARGSALPSLGGNGPRLAFAATPSDGGGGWATLFGGRIDGDAFDGSYGGLAAGFEAVRPTGGGDLTYGIAFAYAEGEGGGTDFDAASIGFYGDYTSGPLMLAASVAFTEFDAEGAVGDGDIVSGRVEAAYDLRGAYDDAVLLAPYGALSFASADFDGGTTGTSTLDGGGADIGVAEVGLRVGRAFDAGGIGAGRLTAEIAYERAFGDTEVEFDGAAFGTAFTTTAAALDEDRLKVGLGVEAEVAPGASVGLRYEGRYGGGSDHRVGIGATFRF